MSKPRFPKGFALWSEALQRKWFKDHGLTFPGQLYVIQKSATQKLFVTRQKRVRGNHGVGSIYWGIYIGKPGGKRYCACRFVGGPDLDRDIAKNPGCVAVEVKA